jgi:hypothetical protein
MISFDIARIIKATITKPTLLELVGLLIVIVGGISAVVLLVRWQ